MSNPYAVPAADFAYRLTRAGVIMSPEPGNLHEAEGVLNPASGRGPDGELYLLPRLVAAGNVSRVGLAKINIVGNAGVGDPRGRGPGAGPELGARRCPLRCGGPPGDLDRGAGVCM